MSSISLFNGRLGKTSKGFRTTRTVLQPLLDPSGTAETDEAKADVIAGSLELQFPPNT